MSPSQFDLVTVGGGLGASALAISMARKGARVLILEKETQFRDRVRGESLAPWGVAEAKELGIDQLLMNSCAKELPWVEMGFGPRNFVDTTPQKVASLSFCHPEMQTALLTEAENTGAEVRRGVSVVGVETGSNGSIVITQDRTNERISARFVVAADGRGSAVRKWLDFATEKNVQPFQFAGVLLTGVSGRDDIVTFLFNPELGLVAGVVPETKQRCRAYLGYPKDRLLLQGADKVSSFLKESEKVAPVMQERYCKAESIGPLATFEAGESWVSHPYRNGVALLGDAASTNDPTFGQGMPTTLRDARVLRDALLGNSDWEQAGEEYARKHNQYFQNTRTVCGWLRTLFQDPSEAARQARARAMPKIAEDPMRVPDHLFSGPDLPTDEEVRSRLFGES
jgi:2-polyprenyl-6-methoxyphenol hydroxylase-like FAD-dependent oxidoreductase